MEKHVKPEDQQKAMDMMTLCVRAQESGVTLALSDTEGDTHIHCCSSDDPEVIRAMLSAEAAHLGTGA